MHTNMHHAPVDVQEQVCVCVYVCIYVYVCGGGVHTNLWCGLHNSHRRFATLMTKTYINISSKKRWYHIYKEDENNF